MTLVNTGQFLPIPTYYAVAGNGSNVIDAADEVVGYVVSVKAGNIVAVHWRTITVTTGATVDVRLETVDASGLPSGTLWGTTTNAPQVVLSADDNIYFRTVLTLPAAVAQGDILAVIIANPTVSFGNMQISDGIAWLPSSIGYPYSIGPTRATKLAGSLLCVLEYDDGSYSYALSFAPLYRNTLTTNTGTNPDETALLFTPDAPMKIIGYTFSASIVAAADYRIGLYQSGNNTPLLTKTVDGDISQTTSNRIFTGLFTGTANLAAGTTYRLAILPTTASNVVVNYADAPTAAILASLHTANIQYSSRNRTGTTDPDTAAWTEVNTRMLCLFPVCDQLDDGAGTGGSTLTRIIGG